ncbi:MAG: cyclase family protein [Sphaerochaeta sp.]|uniref:cyclase family protein n=1 Tax=Sphaerochaeta sp. TaxID=1972642 RepID=UPI002FCC1C28
MIPLTIAGVRFDQFPPSVHASFSFSENQLQDASVKIKKQTQSEAVLLLSTCDRVEVWCEQSKTGLVEPMLRALSLPILAWRDHVYTLGGEACIDHAFSLASGLLSPLFGEDQIISQVLKSLERARFCGCASPLLEYLGREAVTTAKKIQSKINLQVPDETIAEAIEARLGPGAQQVLVIGSSAQARVVAAALASHHHTVTMTFRDLEKADLLLPPGVAAISYTERFSLFSKDLVVISATKGMEYTVTLEETKDVRMFFDLAGVRDIDPFISRKEGVLLYTLQDLDVPLPARSRAIAQADSLIAEDTAKVVRYLAFRRSVEDVQSLAARAANDLVYRLQGPLKECDDGLRTTLYETARKAFSHQLYRQKKGISYKRYDLTRPFHTGMESYAGDPPVVLKQVHTIEREGWNLTSLRFGSHSGTHMDSPFHMLASGPSLDVLDPSRFFCTAYVMDCTGFACIDLQMVCTLEPMWDAILLYTDQGNHPVPLTIEAATWLLDRGVRLFGFDTANADEQGSMEFPLHHLLFSREALILENLTNLEPILGKVVQLTCLPLLFEHADGAPTRVIACVAD